MAKDTWGTWDRSVANGPVVVQTGSSSAVEPRPLIARRWLIAGIVIGLIYIGGCSIGLFWAIQGAEDREMTLLESARP